MSDVLEFRLVLRDVSPLIWRRVHVWTVNLRLKTVLPERRGRTYPYLVAGQRAAPPEDLRGVGEYLERRHWHELHPPFHALKDLATAVQRRLAGEADTDNSALDEALERVSMYVQYTSTQLNISKLRQALLALPQEAQE